MKRNEVFLDKRIKKLETEVFDEETKKYDFNKHEEIHQCKAGKVH